MFFIYEFDESHLLDFDHLEQAIDFFVKRLGLDKLRLEAAVAVCMFIQNLQNIYNSFHLSTCQKYWESGKPDHILASLQKYYG